MPVFSLDLDRSGTVPRILLRGEVDLAAKPAFDAALAAAHRRREPVVVDLSLRDSALRPPPSWS
jgi:hypothetical protein